MQKGRIYLDVFNPITRTVCKGSNIVGKVKSSLSATTGKIVTVIKKRREKIIIEYLV